MLSLISTPIGNLQDISFRAIELLKNADMIFCENTQYSLRLLRHFDIQKPLFSYHKFNEKTACAHILQELKIGRSVCLISDAGTPLISDPGALLVKACIAEGYPVSAAPGPCALIQAFICSGIACDRFQFIGFLPKKEKELRFAISDWLEYPGVTIGYETPHRVKKTVEVLTSIEPSAFICIAKELTKIHESFLRGTAQDVLETILQKPLKGELVFIIKGEQKRKDFSSLSIEEHVENIQKQYLCTKKEAIKIVADLRDVRKRDLYQKLLKSSIESIDNSTV